MNELPEYNLVRSCVEKASESRDGMESMFPCLFPVNERHLDKKNSHCLIDGMMLFNYILRVAFMTHNMM